MVDALERGQGQTTTERGARSPLSALGDASAFLSGGLSFYEKMKKLTQPQPRHPSWGAAGTWNYSMHPRGV